MKHPEGDIAESGTSFDESTPLARELAEMTRRRQAIAAEQLPLPENTRVFTVANQLTMLRMALVPAFVLLTLAREFTWALVRASSTAHPATATTR